MMMGTDGLFATNAVRNYTYSAPACNMRRMNIMILTLKIKYSVVTLVNNNLSL